MGAVDCVAALRFSTLNLSYLKPNLSFSVPGPENNPLVLQVGLQYIHRFGDILMLRQLQIVGNVGRNIFTDPHGFYFLRAHRCFIISISFWVSSEAVSSRIMPASSRILATSDSLRMCSSC